MVMGDVNGKELAPEKKRPGGADFSLRPSAFLNPMAGVGALTFQVKLTRLRIHRPPNKPGFNYDRGPL